MANFVLWDKLVTTGVLLGLFVLAYCKWTDRTMGDLLRDLRDALGAKTEEIEISSF